MYKKRLGTIALLASGLFLAGCAATSWSKAG